MSLSGKIRALFSKQPPIHEDSVNELHIQLNDKIQPIARGELYESPIVQLLATFGDGEIVNAGTMQSESGEIEYCDIDIAFSKDNFDREALIATLAESLNRIGAPVGSFIKDGLTGKTISIGSMEGIGIYLNGTDLPQQTYSECDVNVVIAEIQKLLSIQNQELRFWQGPTETALYFYGKSFDEMKRLTADFISHYPLCQKCRVERVA